MCLFAVGRGGRSGDLCTIFVASDVNTKFKVSGLSAYSREERERRECWFIRLLFYKAGEIVYHFAVECARFEGRATSRRSTAVGYQLIGACSCVYLEYGVRIVISRGGFVRHLPPPPRASNIRFKSVHSHFRRVRVCACRFFCFLNIYATINQVMSWWWLLGATVIDVQGNPSLPQASSSYCSQSKSAPVGLF